MPDRNLSFEVAHPSFVYGQDLEQLQELERRHFSRVFGDQLTAEEVATFGVGSRAKAWRRPNKAGLRGFYGHPRIALAYEGSRPTHMVYAVNNASIHRGLKNHVKTAAAMWVPTNEGLEHRHVRFREMIGDDEVIIGALGALLLERFYKRQPVSDWPYAPETDLRKRLDTWGLTAIGRETVPLGEDGEVTQLHYMGRSVGDVKRHIMAIQGVADMVSYARSTMPTPIAESLSASNLV